MKHVVRFVFSIMLLIGAGGVAAQPKGTPPVIGKPLPDFSFDVKYAEPGIKKLSALRGKPVLLYFFGKGCVGSFHGLQKVNKLYQQYSKKITFIAVASDNRDKIGEAYERYQKHYNLTLPVAIDSVNYRQLGIYAFPTLILLDENGVVQVVSYTLSQEAVELFIQDKPFFFHNTSQQAKQEKKFDWEKPLFVNGNGGSGDEFLQRSLISEWKPGMPRMTLNPADKWNPEPFAKIQTLNIAGSSLAELYRIAYFGRSMAWEPWDTVAYGNYHFNVVLEVKDSSLFKHDLDAGKNMFNYTQVMQPRMRTKENMMRIMQTDLKNCFGYDVTVETRKMPCLRLVAKPGAAEKLKAVPGRGRTMADMIEGGAFYNFSVANLCIFINATIHLSSIDLPMLDETGISGNIDFMLKGVMTSLEDVTRALRTQGLDIVPGEREMKVMVIRDPAEHVK